MFSYNMFPTLSLFEKPLYLAQNMSEKSLFLMAIFLNKKYFLLHLGVHHSCCCTFKAGYKNIIENDLISIDQQISPYQISEESTSYVAIHPVIYYTRDTNKHLCSNLYNRIQYVYYQDQHTVH